MDRRLVLEKLRVLCLKVLEARDELHIYAHSSFVVDSDSQRD
jgi:hypothetical protein